MITTIRITNVQEAETALLMITAYLNSVKGGSAKPETNPEKDTVPEKTVTAPKKKPYTKPKVEKTEKPAEDTAVPVEEDDTPADNKGTKPTISLADLTALAKQAVKNTGRDEVASLIATFGTGKLSSVPTEKYGELEEELVKLA